ncbi:F0F1 ATP synthase subunit delta [Psittacicella hinzii]|uniref:ATP synthase subunit delta n=1 Tax=Psittacicella hinzii TaxID=2028575 RepID=A0A3A1YPP6_9GAMM|nr:F0F1 ATP synthase subunit delta [Psittacicella hinzii]RIY39585.1 hypothetical protein CKF58_01995 [Psittacicella hinzii]
MENVTTISRPYATAVFEYAIEQSDKEQALNFWGNVLEALKAIMEDEVAVALLAEHSDYQEEIKKFVLEVLPEQLVNEHVINFLSTVNEHSRFAYLPGICEFYQKLRENYDLPAPVTVVTARKLSDEQIKQIGSAVATKLGRVVKLEIQEDASIMSGIIIKTDDFTIDCSGRKTLEQLSSQITK